MTPTRLPSGAWRCRVYIGKDENGKQKFISITRNSKNECMRDAAELALHHHETTRNITAMTLGEAIDDYLKIKSNILSPSTIRGYKTIRKNNLQPEMDLKLELISDRIAQKAINREAVDKSPKTVSNIYGLLSVVMKQYTNRELHVSLPKAPKRKPNILTEEQIRKLIAAAKDRPEELTVLLALMLGLRRSEILGITADDYNPVDHTLYIHKTVVMNDQHQYVEKPTTKTDSSTRTLTVPPYLGAKLEHAFAENIKICPCAPAHLSSIVGRLCNIAGIPMMTLHDLRRQNASVMLALGIADKYAMERGGWSSPSVMKSVYQLTMSDMRQKVDDTINRYFEQLVDTKVDTAGKNT